MGIVFRQSAKSSIVVVFGALLGIFIIWLSTKYIPNKHQFGFIQNQTNYAVTLSQMLLLGLNYTLGVYIHRYAGKKKGVLLTICFAVPAIVMALVTIIYFILRSWILHHYQPEDVPLMAEYFGWLPFYTVLVLYQLMFEQYLGTQMKQAVAAFMREVVLRFLNIALIILYGFQVISFHNFVVGLILSYIVPVTIFFVLSTRTKDFKFSADLAAFSKADYKELIHFSWYHSLLALVVLFMGYMDMLLIPFYDHRGFGALAVYRIAVLLISLLQLPAKAMLSASFTVLAKAFADNDRVKAKDIFLRSSVNVLIPTVGIAILLCCNLHNAVAVINNGYGEMAPIFLILFIGRFADIATGMNDQVLSIANYYKFNFYLSAVLTAVFFVFIRVLVPRYGLYGAAWSTTLTLVIYNVAKYLFVKRKLDMQPFAKDTILILVCGIPSLAAGYFFPYMFNPARHVYMHSFIDAGVRSTIIIVIYSAMLLWLKPSKDLVEYIALIKKEKRLF